VPGHGRRSERGRRGRDQVDEGGGESKPKRKDKIGVDPAACEKSLQHPKISIAVRESKRSAGRHRVRQRGTPSPFRDEGTGEAFAAREGEFSGKIRQQRRESDQRGAITPRRRLKERREGEGGYAVPTEKRNSERRGSDGRGKTSLSKEIEGSLESLSSQNDKGSHHGFLRSRR